MKKLGLAAVFHDVLDTVGVAVIVISLLAILAAGAVLLANGGAEWVFLAIGAHPSVIFPYYWRVRARLPERFGKPCRVLVRARSMNSCLVEFEDGYRVVTSRNYLRKLADTEKQAK